MNTPICSRCQLPTEAEHMLGGKCVDCAAAENIAAISGTGETFDSFVGGLVEVEWDAPPVGVFPVATFTSLDTP